MMALSMQNAISIHLFRGTGFWAIFGEHALVRSVETKQTALAITWLLLVLLLIC